MHFLLLAAVLPGLYCDQDAGKAASLKQAGVARVYVPAAQVAAWKQQGVPAQAFDAASYAKAVTPGVEFRADVASATRIPWVDANGWLFLRAPHKSYVYDAPPEKAGLAAAEAFSYGVDAVVRCGSGDLRPFAKMLEFLRGVDAPPLPVMANIGVIDDGSDTTGEVLNLLARHNLLFRMEKTADPKLDLNVRIGSQEYPKSAAEDPYSFSQTMRQKLGDEKRLLRIYGSQVIIAHMNGDGQRARLHLLNYGGRKVQGLRVRVLGTFAHGTIHSAEMANAALSDYTQTDGGTEFSIPEMGSYTVIDLR